MVSFKREREWTNNSYIMYHGFNTIIAGYVSIQMNGDAESLEDNRKTEEGI